jgi:hypothetical protein
MLIGFSLFYLTSVSKTEYHSTTWIAVSLVGLMVMSYLGDPNFIYRNFLPIGPQEIIPTPYDIIILTVFAILIYISAYRSSIRLRIRDGRGETV